MASLAFTGRRFVKDDALSPYFASQFVTLAAGDILVSAGQWKWGALVMIEASGLPPSRIVTSGAVCGISACGELPSVGILVTTETLFRGCPEIHILQSHFLCWRLVAIFASDSAVRP